MRVRVGSGAQRNARMRGKVGRTRVTVRIHAQMRQRQFWSFRLPPVFHASIGRAERTSWLRPALGLAVAAILAVACESCALIRQSPEQRAQHLEPMLSAAGFRMIPAHTPAKLKKLQSLPPLKVRYYLGNEGEAHYWFADPYRCGCLYMGGQRAYQRYEKMRVENRIAREREEAAQQNLEASENYEMAPFGFPPFFF